MRSLNYWFPLPRRGPRELFLVRCYFAAGPMPGGGNVTQGSPIKRHQNIRQEKHDLRHKGNDQEHY